MMLRRTLSSLAGTRPLLALRTQPLFCFSRFANNAGEEDDFEFDFNASNEQKPRSSFRNQKFDYTPKFSGRRERGFGTQTSELLGAESLTQLIALIEQQTPFNAKYESMKLLQLTTQLIRKAPARSLAEARRSKAAEQFFTDVLREMTQQDKPYVWIAAFTFLSVVRTTPVLSTWMFDRNMMTQLFARIEQLSTDESVSEPDIYRALRASLALGSNGTGALMRRLSTSLMGVDGPLTAEQAGMLAYLGGTFGFASDSYNWARKLSENAAVLDDESLNTKAEIFANLRTARDYQENVEVARRMEDSLVQALESGGDRANNVRLKLLNACVGGKGKKLRDALLRRAVQIIREQPELLKYNDMTAIAEFLVRHHDTHLTNELVNALIYLGENRPDIMKKRLGAIGDAHVLTTVRMIGRNRDLKRAFGNAIVAHANDSSDSSRSINVGLANFMPREELQTFIDSLASRAAQLSDFDLKSLLIFARWRGLTVPESLREAADEAEQNSGICSAVVQRMTAIEGEHGVAAVRKLASGNLNYRARVDLAHLVPQLGEEIMKPLAGRTSLRKLLDAEPDMLLSMHTFELMMYEMREGMKRQASLMQLVRLDRLLNRNESVAAMRQRRPAEFAKIVAHTVEAIGSEPVEGRAPSNPSSLISVLSQSIDEELLVHSKLLSVRALLDSILTRIGDSTSPHNYELVRKLNALMLSAGEKADAGYIAVLTSEGSDRRREAVRLIEHGFVEQKAYAAAGKLGELDAAYDSFLAELDDRQTTQRGLRALLMVLNKSDAELLPKIQSRLSLINEDNALWFVLIALKRFLLTKESAVLEAVLAHVEQLDNVRLHRGQLLRLFELANSESIQSEPLRALLTRAAQRANLTRLARGSVRNVETVADYLIDADVPLDSMMADERVNNYIKSFFYERLMRKNKQPELAAQLYTQTPSNVVQRMTRDMDGLVRTMLMPQDGTPAAEQLYAQIGAQQPAKLSTAPSSRYALLWIGARKPELVAKLLAGKEQLFARRNAGWKFIAQVLKLAGRDVDENVSFNDIKAAELVSGDKVLVADNFVSPVKDKVLSELFPGKSVVQLRLTDVRAAVTADQLQELLKSVGLIDADFTEEQRGKIEEAIQAFKNPPQKGENEAAGTSATDGSDETSSSDDLSNDSSSSDSELEQDNK